MKPAIRCIFLIMMMFSGCTFGERKPSQPSEKCTQLETRLIEICLDKANAKTDKRLNQVYQNIMKQLKVNEKNQLLNTQKAWLSNRSIQCEDLIDKLEIKACYLDLTDLKVNELQEKAIDLMPNFFEGVWKSCFNFSEEDGEVYQRYGGQPICTSSYYLQQGKNICGVRESWASGRFYRKKIHYKLVESTSAQSKKLCEEEGDSATKKCYVNSNDSDDGTNKQKDYKDWEENNKLAIKICNKQLSEGGIYLLDHNYCDSIKQQTGGNKAIISKQDKETILRKNNWLSTCLNYKE